MLGIALLRYLVSQAISMAMLIATWWDPFEPNPYPQYARDLIAFDATEVHSVVVPQDSGIRHIQEQWNRTMVAGRLAE